MINTSLCLEGGTGEAQRITVWAEAWQTDCPGQRTGSAPGDGNFTCSIILREAAVVKRFFGMG
jgi:hypothetical protein